MEMKPFLLSSPFFHLPFLSSLFLLPLLLPLLLWSPPHAYAQDVQPLYSCENTVNYINTSTFATNLRRLIPSLSTNASLNNGFFNTSAGNSSDRVYGLVLCRGDATPAVCRNCIGTAGEELMKGCSNRSAIIWYDNCLLRYSNRNFFGSADNNLKIYMWNTANTTDPSAFNWMLGSIFSNLPSKAAFEPWNRMYATAEADYPGFDFKIYGLVQCTRDISTTDCKSCLDSLIYKVLSTQINSKRGGRFLGSSCNMRFEMYSFFGP